MHDQFRFTRNWYQNLRLREGKDRGMAKKIVNCGVTEGLQDGVVDEEGIKQHRVTGEGLINKCTKPCQVGRNHFVASSRLVSCFVCPHSPLSRQSSFSDSSLGFLGVPPRGKEGTRTKIEERRNGGGRG